MTKEDAIDKLQQLTDEFNMKTSEQLLSKLQQEGFDIAKLSKEETRFIENATSKTDNTFELKEISKKSKYFGERLNNANLDSFEKVELMYLVGFFTGVVLILSAIGIFVHNAINGATGEAATSGNILSAVFGSLGVADMLLLLYTPVRELQKSRGNISKLSALYNEWQYISNWTGKTYNVLNEKLKTNQELEPKQEKLINEMRWLIDLKSDTTTKLANLMTQMVTHSETKNLAVSISSKPEAPEVNSKVELEADVHGISASEVDKITYLWSEESGNITMDKKNKRQAEFEYDKAGEFTFKIDVKSGDKTGSAESKITIKPKISAIAEPTKVQKNNKIKLIAKVDGLDDEEEKKLSYKWKETSKSSTTISSDDKEETEITPTKEGKLKFKVTITKDQKKFAAKEVEVEVTA
ncbi:PKD domain-containing protein [Nitrosopumilus ureiphilus]|uniref:PKD domain-containing protein n=1 Tax=Nitrosopumilus ureiphilus TaxID=1470067 RepID=UPI0015C7357E|nr:hypothetical protein [Nitrosopumilus ureiphilus]